MIAWVASGIIAGIFMLFTWDEDNNWKVWSCFIVLIAAVNVIKIDAKADGYEDGICDAFKIVDNREGVTLLSNFPDYCDD